MSSQASQVIPFPGEWNEPEPDAGELSAELFAKILRDINYPGRDPGAWTPILCEIFRNASPEEQRWMDTIVAIEQTQPPVKRTFTETVKGKKVSVEKEVRLPIRLGDRNKVVARRLKMDQDTRAAIAAKVLKGTT